MYALYLALASVFARAALGASNPGIPTCAFKCVTGYGGCQEFDVKCICSNKPYIAHLACCVSKACDAADQEATLQFADGLCAGQSVTDLPQTATCASSLTASQSTGSSSTTLTGSGTTTASTTTASTTTNAAAQASSSSASSSAAAPSASPGAAVMNKIDGMGLGMMIAGLAAAL